MFPFKKQSSVTWLVVFLGNPGQKYANTRHNAGFMAAEVMEKEHGVKIDRLKFGALVGECSFGDERALLMKPQTYMNLSGTAVGPAASFYKIPPEQVIVVSDDVSLPVGKIRIRRSGSAGGHNGLKDIISHIGDGFPRVKVGVGAKPPEYDMVDWVLASFKGNDAAEIQKAVSAAAKAVEFIIQNGVDAAMNKFN